MLKSLKFGDIFIKDNDEYIWLVNTEDGSVYAAKVLNNSESIAIETFCNRKLGSSNPQATKNSLLFCYVKLTSVNLENRLAHFKTADNTLSPYPLSTTGFKLNEDDKKAILNEILNPDVNLPKELKDLASTLSI